MGEAKTRTEAVTDAVTEYITEKTGITIRPPPLKNDGDCTIRVNGSRTVFRTLDKVHELKELRLSACAKASDSRTGIRLLTKIEDLFSVEKDLPQLNEAQITDISVGEISEENDYGEWIYQMMITIRYFY